MMQVNRMTPGNEFAMLGVLAGTLGTTSRLYHVGFVVPDLDEAMHTLGASLGVAFAEPMELPFTTLQTPQGPREVKLRLSYSTRPSHIELIASAPGSLWDFGSALRGHHVGVWAEDIRAEAARLESLGRRKVWWHADERGEVSSFSYHETPYGFYIELVDAAARAFYPDWFRAADPALAPKR